MDALLIRIAERPFQTMFIATGVGMLLGILTATAIHWAWINTVYRAEVERQYESRYIRNVGEVMRNNQSCVKKWKDTPYCNDRY